MALEYSVVGRGRPLVLLHAFPLSSALFGPLLADGLTDGWRVITPDLRGFGASRLGEDDPSVAAMAGDVVALMDRLEIDTAVVGGVSMGGYVTMELLRRARERVRGVLLVDTKAGADTEQVRAGRLAMAQAVLEQGWEEVLDPTLDVLLGPTTRAERADVVSLVSGWLRAADPAAIGWAQRAIAARPDSYATLAGAGVPGAVVVGEEDILSPLEEATLMADALGTAPRVVATAGHLAVVEQPSAAAVAISAGLRDLAAAER